ncbi:hypothetical protein A3H89_03490 [Candidatus Amesbacteria bacterium RIFCSPLOWO2_02_FULL_48_11]|nr:MAG: hypothetical protein A2702_01940 [Candidatus Amesbacteria bacterium RIFCSPHIGHO2_01_FULL_48_75]OGD07727.1 MAG: hypothetical protein A3H89_03490 [Candidatus Amesbacteria bacterium RIFCSPLOWO2_02_FULL_48_11]
MEMEARRRFKTISEASCESLRQAMRRAKVQGDPGFALREDKCRGCGARVQFWLHQGNLKGKFLVSWGEISCPDMTRLTS